MALQTPINKLSDTQILEQITDSAFALGYKYGAQWLLISTKMRYKIDPKIATLAVSADGWIFVNPTYWASLSGPERQGVLAHEFLHPTLLHFDRARALGMISEDGHAIPGREYDLKLWNFAGDMAINPPIMEAGITLPQGCLTPPDDYTGSRDTESIWYFLRSQQRTGGAGGSGDSRGDEAPAQGCGTLPPQDPKSDQQTQGEGAQGNGTQAQAPTDWAQVARDAKALAEQQGAGIGKGARAFAQALSPAPSRVHWRKVLGTGFTHADAMRGKDRPSYSKISRRHAGGAFILPGWTQTSPKIVFIADASGSMDRKWVAQIASEIKRCLGMYPTAKCYLIVHTDGIVWEGWITPGAEDRRLPEALAFSGGTDANQAYARAGELGRWDVCVHLTDCEIGRWPDASFAKRLIIGAFGNGASRTEIPAHARVIPCSEVES